MSEPHQRHVIETWQNLESWRNKPLLREIYTGFYRRIAQHIDRSMTAPILELGSGIGSLRDHLPLDHVLCSDIFRADWLDLVCDAYELPFAAGSVSHVVMFDTFHHLARPKAALREARRVLCAGGRIILFEPYVGLCSYAVYGLLHPEPVALAAPIDASDSAPADRPYYAAQGNATRLFFHSPNAAGWDWEHLQLRVVHAEAFAAFAYLLSGGFSGPALYPWVLKPAIEELDRGLSRLPRVFGARCLVVLEAIGAP